jgi:23S rRNA (adenine2503-C2)-methyltransferase
MKKYTLPTGYLFTDKYSRGELETLSIGDYGKGKNIKADFLGFYDEINGVQNGKCKPLSEKWVITLSTQYGCSMHCRFCDVPNIKFKGNVSFGDLQKQLYSAIKLFPNVHYTDRLNIHFARMGEPTINHQNVVDFAKWMFKNKYEIHKETGLRTEVIHPVLSTCIPQGSEKKILDWVDLKNNLYDGQAGLQLSINSTDNKQRDYMFNFGSKQLEDIALLGESFNLPIERKYCLNFALSDDSIIDENKLAYLFDSEKFMVKITPIHNNNSCSKNKITTTNGYKSFIPYKDVEERLKKVGFDVLVFIPSMDEENGLVTCGNAILGGGILKI